MDELDKRLMEELERIRVKINGRKLISLEIEFPWERLKSVFNKLTKVFKGGKCSQ